MTLSVVLMCFSCRDLVVSWINDTCNIKHIMLDFNCEQTLKRSYLRVRGSGRIQERVVVQKPRHGWVQLSFFLHLRLRLRLHGDVFDRLGVGANILRDQRRLLPLQPVCYHVTFPLLETDPVLLGSSQCSQCSQCPTDLNWLVEGSRSPWPAAFLCTPPRSRRSPPEGKTHWSCTGSSELQQHWLNVSIKQIHQKLQMTYSTWLSLVSVHFYGKISLVWNHFSIAANIRSYLLQHIYIYTLYKMDKNSKYIKVYRDEPFWI